jgi:hypothetical protein
MSSTTQSNETSDIETSGRENISSAEEEVAGPQPQVAQPARTVHVSTPFALSLVRRLAEIEAQNVCAFDTHNIRIALNITLSLEPNHSG